jgi:hypothetical protein
MYSPETIIGVRREAVLLLALIVIAVIAGLIVGLLVNENARIAFLAILLGWLEP